jgi:hypothetical protein
MLTSLETWPKASLWSEFGLGLLVLDRKNKLCNLKIKPVMVLRAFNHGFQAPVHGQQSLRQRNKV